MAKRRIVLASLATAVLALAAGTAVSQSWAHPAVHQVSAPSTVPAVQSVPASNEPSPADVRSRRSLTIGAEAQPRNVTEAQPRNVTPVDLQGRLDEARNQGGGVVAIADGNWSLPSTINVWGGITLQGAGAQSCLVMGASATDILNIAGSNVTLQNFCLVGPGGVASDGGNGRGKGVVNLNKRQSLQSVTVRNLRISFTQGHAIELYGSPQARLRGIIIDTNMISKAGGHGVVSGFTDGGRISSNVIVASALGGMAYGDGAIDIEGSSALTIENNIVDGSMYSGIQANTLVGSLVRNNTASNTHGSGFAFWNCSSDTFTNNISAGNSDQGFYWAFNATLPGIPGNNLIEGNLARDNGKNGFQLAQQTNVRFIGNTAADNNSENGLFWSGLMVQQHSADIQVSSNVFQNTTAGRGQIFGVAAPDTTTSRLSIAADNRYLQMRQQDVYQ